MITRICSEIAKHLNEAQQMIALQKYDKAELNVSFARYLCVKYAASSITRTLNEQLWTALQLIRNRTYAAAMQKIEWIQQMLLANSTCHDVEVEQATIENLYRAMLDWSIMTR